MFTGQLLPKSLAHLIDVPAKNVAVRPREINELKNAHRLLMRDHERFGGMHPILVKDNNLSRLDLPDKIDLEEIEGAGLARHDPGVVFFSDDKRPPAKRIPDRDQPGLRQE